jgi:hypothetical protein
MIKITIPPDLIPELRTEMPVFRLGPPILAQEGMIHRFVRTVAPQAEFKAIGHTGLQAAHDGKRLVSFINPAIGECMMFPGLGGLKPGKGLAARANVVAAKMALDKTLFPTDGTVVSALPAVTLMGAKHVKGKERSEPEEYLSYVRFQRRVNRLPVWGPGTRAMVAVDANGAVCGFAHRWRNAVITGDHVKPAARTTLVRSIKAQIAKGALSGNVSVDRVTTGYYDGGGGLLQPVHRFEATIEHTRLGALRSHPAASHIVGYSSIGTAPEPLPEVGVLHGYPPAYAPNVRREPMGHGGDDPTIARYVIQNAEAGWVSSANSFLSGLQLANFLGSPIPFTDSQYYWAEPRLFLTEKDSFVNSVHIALAEAHGNWWKLWLDKNDGNANVFLSDIPSGGYGGPGSALAYLIIHSCEVMPTQTDESTSFDVWWNIFQGIHAVVGYRTDMFIDDGVTYPFGFWIGLGAPVVSSWLNAVMSDDSYGPGVVYYDGNRQMIEPMGRASAVAVYGHVDDTVNDLGSLGPAECLTEWWFDN